MGGGTGSSSSTYSPPPEVAAAYKALLEKANPLVDQQQVRYTPDQAAYYAGLVPATLAPFTPYQVEGMQDVAGLRGFSTPYVQSATDLYTQAANPLNRQQFSGDAVNQYMSPYMQNVMQGAVQNINETNAQQQQQVLGNTIAKGAFGGDRAGIVRGQLARQQDLANNATLANLLNQGYTQALGEFNQQQGVDLATQLQNRNLQSAAGTNLLNAAQQGQGMALQQSLAEIGVGQQKQQQNQQELMTAYQNFLNEQGYPYQQLGWLGNMVSGAATGMGGTTTSNPAQPSGMSQIIGGLGALGSVGAMFGSNGILSGLGAGLAAISDERVKDNIQPIGKTFDGQNIYKFNYKGDPRTQMGLMAQEVEKRHPEAVGQVHGIKTVDYDAATSDAAHKHHFYTGGRTHYDDGGGVAPMSKVKPQDFLGGLQIKGATPHVPQAPTSQKSDDLASVIKSATPGLKGLNSLFTKDNNKIDGTPAPDAPTPPPRPAEFSDTVAFSEAQGGRIHYAAGGDALPSSLAGLSSATSKLPGGAPAQSSGGGGGGLGGLGNQVDQNAVTTENIYRALLHRSAEPAAIAGRSSELAAGTSTPQSIFNQTKASPEYQALMKDTVASSKLPAPPQAPAAYQNYQNLVNSGHASLADLQSGYNNYLKSAQTPTMPYMALPTVTSAKAEADAAAKANDPTATLTPEEIATLKQQAASSSLVDQRGGWRGGRFNYASGGGTDITLQYGAQTLADLQNIAEAQAGSGLGGLNPNSEALALKDYGLATGGRAHFDDGGPATSEDPMDKYARAISANESGGRYNAIGPETKSGDRAYGKYQVMGNNIPSWTEETLGKRMSPEEFLRDPAAQEQTFRQKFGSYVKQYGNPQDAASMWFSGKPVTEAGGRSDVTGTTVPDYIRRFNTALTSTAGGQDLVKQINEGAVRSGQADRVRTTPIDPNTRLPIKEASSKEGLWGELGVSTTPSERLAMFNAFATLAGTPGKFGVGLAAAGRTYADTLLKSQDQYQKGVGAQAQAEHAYAGSEREKAEAAAKNRLQTPKGLITFGQGPEGQQTMQNVPLPKPGQTVTTGGQQQAGGTEVPTAIQQAASGQTSGAPQAPIGPVHTDAPPETQNKFQVMQQLADQAGNTLDPGTQEAYRKQAMEQTQRAMNESRAAQDGSINLSSSIKAVASLPEKGVLNPGAAGNLRYGIANYFNTMARIAGSEAPDLGKDPITNQQILEKNSTLAAQASQKGIGKEAGFWLNGLKAAYPNVDLNKETSNNILANMIVGNGLAKDRANFANTYQSQDYAAGMGYNMETAFNTVNPQSMYIKDMDTIRKLLNLNVGGSNAITDLLDKPTAENKKKFDEMVQSRYGVSNLSRYFQ